MSKTAQKKFKKELGIADKKSDKKSKVNQEKLRHDLKNKDEFLAPALEELKEIDQDLISQNSDDIDWESVVRNEIEKDKVELTFLYGNLYRPLRPEEIAPNSKNTHKWTGFLRLKDKNKNDLFAHLIDHVKFHLHESFKS